MQGLGRLPKVVAFGGGHGLSASLAALRRVTDNLTAVVTVADDGGSSGRLRRELGCLPPGDLRMALAALCSDDQEGRTWASVLQSRFTGEGTLAGHAIGNLLIAGLWQQLGDPVAGLDMVADLLRTRGRVLPMSSTPLEIEADVLGLDDGMPDELSTLSGQAAVASTAGTVQAVRIIPESAPARQEAVDAIMDADSIVLGPGSWFTSVIPHLLVADLAEAITSTTAQRVLVLNIAPADETRGFSASRHIELLAEHAPTLRLDVVIADDGFACTDKHLGRYVASLGARLEVADLGMRDGSPRHDTNRLASVFSEVLAL